MRDRDGEMTPATVQYRLTTFGRVGLARYDGTSVASVVSRSKRLALLVFELWARRFL